MHNLFMTYRVTFQKQIETGILAGLTVDGGFDVATWSDGARQIREMRRNPIGKDCVTGNCFTRIGLRLESVWEDGSVRVEMTDEVAA